MRLLYSYLKLAKRPMILALVLAAVNQCFSLVEPMITGKMFQQLAIDHDQYAGRAKDFVNDLLFFLLMSMGAAMISRIAKNFQDYFTNVVIQRTGAKMYSDGIQHSLDLPYEVFEDQRSGETLGKLQKVRIDSEKFITVFIGILFQSIVGLLFVLNYAVSIHWAIGPLFLITAPLLAFVSSLLSKRIKIISKKILGETTALAGATTESLRNIELVKSLGLTQQEVNRLNNTTTKILGLELKKVKYIRSLSFIQGTTVNFIRTCLIAFLYWLVFQEQIEPGQLWTLTIYSFFVFGPLQEMGNVITAYREAEASLNNFNELMNTPKEYKPTSPQGISELNSFTFDNVTFGHRTAQSPALDKISFNVKKGETVAFVGPSGSGKTTLVKLLVGLYQPQNGRILYNSIDGKDLDIYSLRKQIGFVTQDTQLFAGTIKENLLFVKPDATDAQIMEALNKASCSKLLARAENGIETMIGEGGIKISGGEKQRLSIARALLREPKLLVLDEATSALDSLTEEEINETVKLINSNRDIITILIAHRLSTIMHADKIYVLERGEMAEAGTHQELLAEKGLYYAMWRQQIGERKR
jgi:ATP-binding cassette subfamily B protein